MFDTKLYNKYYPIQNEMDKKDFLDTNHNSLYQELVQINKLCKSDIYIRRNDYISKMKKPTTIFGHLNYKNIGYNENLIRKMDEDVNIKNLEKHTNTLNELAYKLIMNDFDSISFDDINYVLLYLNKEHHKNISLFVCLSIFIIIIFIYRYVII